MVHELMNRRNDPLPSATFAFGLDQRSCVRFVMILLVGSLVALLVGPAIAFSFRDKASAVAVLDGFVLSALFGLVTIHLAPESVEAGGWLAAAAIAAGLLAPLALGKIGATDVRSTWLSSLALGGFALHALFDGAALGVSAGHDEAVHHEHGGHVGHDHGFLAIAVLLHRVPVGLSVWRWVATRSRWQGVLVLSVLCAATLVGFIASQPLVERSPPRSVAVFQGLVTGLLLHVVFAHVPRSNLPSAIDNRRHRLFGAAAGVVALVGVSVLQR